MTTVELFKPSKRRRFYKEIGFPTAWNELELPELLAISKELINPNTADAATGKVNIFLAILRHRLKKSQEPRTLGRGLQRGQGLQRGWEALLNVDDVSTAGLDAIQFIFEKNDLTNLPEKRIAFGFLTHLAVVGPDSFDNITCGEYEDAGVFAQLFSQDPKVEWLVKLAAVIYRRKGTPYHGYKIEPYLKHFATLKPERLYLPMIWFTGCSSTLAQYFPDVFSKGKGESDIQAFTKTIHAGAGPKNGTRDDIRKMNLKEFLFDMQLEAVKAKEELAQIEAARR